MAKFGDVCWFGTEEVGAGLTVYETCGTLISLLILRVSMSLCSSAVRGMGEDLDCRAFGVRGEAWILVFVVWEVGCRVPGGGEGLQIQTLGLEWTGFQSGPPTLRPRSARNNNRASPIPEFQKHHGKSDLRVLPHCFGESSGCSLWGLSNQGTRPKLGGGGGGRGLQAPNTTTRTLHHN